MDDQNNTNLRVDEDESSLPNQNSNAVESELQSNIKPSKKAKTTTSSVWSCFKDLGVGKDGKPRAECLGCRKEYVAGGSKYGTSSISRHVKDFKMFDSQVVTKTGKSQLDTYLDETKLEWSHFQNMNVLQYWKDNRYRFPDLALMASDILSIPITTVASESAFSIGARVLNKYRSCLLPQNVQALLCARNWFHGFIHEDEDDEMTIKESTSTAGSNVPEDEDEED